MRDERVFVFGEIPGIPDRIWRKLTPSEQNWFQGTPCWEWQKQSRSRGNYGKTFIGRLLREEFPGFPPKSRTMDVHRLMYLVTFGDPGELQIDHLCRNRPCANPLHLEAVTQPENLRRGLSSELIREIAREQAAKTHCKRGHLLEGYNLIINYDADGTRHRHCRECQRRTWREFARRKRQERKAEANA